MSVFVKTYKGLEIKALVNDSVLIADILVKCIRYTDPNAILIRGLDTGGAYNAVKPDGVCIEIPFRCTYTRLFSAPEDTIIRYGRQFCLYNDATGLILDTSHTIGDLDWYDGMKFTILATNIQEYRVCVPCQNSMKRCKHMDLI